MKKLIAVALTSVSMTFAASANARPLEDCSYPCSLKASSTWTTVAVVAHDATSADVEMTVKSARHLRQFSLGDGRTRWGHKYFFDVDRRDASIYVSVKRQGDGHRTVYVTVRG